MPRHSKIEIDRAPCGCPAGPPSGRFAFTDTRCPASHEGYARQHGTDMLVPLTPDHIRYFEEIHNQMMHVRQSWASESTQMGGIITEEGPSGYDIYNSAGLNSQSPLVLAPPHGTNMNESRQLERAVIEGRAAQISPSLHRYFRAETEDDIDVDPNGSPYYASPRRYIPIPMMPAHYQAPTGSMLGTNTMAVHFGRPSSRGNSSSHHSGRRSSNDQSSSGYDNNNYFAGAGGAFEENPDRASQMTMSEDFVLFPFEEDQE